MTGLHLCLTFNFHFNTCQQRGVMDQRVCPITTGYNNKGPLMKMTHLGIIYDFSLSRILELQMEFKGEKRE